MGGERPANSHAESTLASEKEDQLVEATRRGLNLVGSCPVGSRRRRARRRRARWCFESEQFAKLAGSSVAERDSSNRAAEPAVFERLGEPRAQIDHPLDPFVANVHEGSRRQLVGAVFDPSPAR
jgi:hypothetical protein